MKILVSGFDPFGGESINPAWEAVRLLPTHILGAEVRTIQLPTVFHESARLLIDEINQYQPDVVVCVGQAGGRVGVTPERVAINIDDARISDNAGNQPIDIEIQVDGAPAYFSTLPVKAMVERMKMENIPTQLSNTAGTFVCNHIMYQALHYVTVHQLETQAGFIHVPFIPEQVVNRVDQPSMPLSEIVRALTVCLETIMEYHGKDDLKVIGGAEH